MTTSRMPDAPPRSSQRWAGARQGLADGVIAAAPAVPPSRSVVLRGLVTTARPTHWVKNLLVFAAPAAAASVHRIDVLVPAMSTFVAFCLVASGTYCLNDVRDAESDRRHPEKRRRAVAAGMVPEETARAVGVGLLLAGMALGLAAGPGVATIIAGYVLLTTAYTYALKDIAILDIATISVGFLLRALAGGVAAGLMVTDWFVIVVSFGALFLASGKRFSELRAHGPTRDTRAALTAYSEPFLRNLTFAALTVTILAYCAWIFDRPGDDPWLTASVLPLVLGLLRYGLHIERGEAEAPDHVILRDGPVQALGLGWILLFSAGIYLP